MLSYTVIVSNEAGSDLDEIADYIASEYKSALDIISLTVSSVRYRHFPILLEHTAKVPILWPNSSTLTPRL